MTHWLAVYLLHPLRGDGYLWWSGIGSDLGELSILAALLTVAKHHNCHHKGCWLPGHRHPQYGWPACRLHWHEAPVVSGRMNLDPEVGLTTSDNGGVW